MTESSDISRAVPFSYADEPSNRWMELLGRIKRGGAHSLQVPVCWGAHEQLRGSRDFSKVSRLRLEKFLQSAHEAGLAVEIVLGFPLGHEALPAWTAEIAEKTLVPASFWDREGLNLVTVPSLYDRDFLESFIGFLDEAFSILALYRQPEGPISAISFDFGSYELDLCAMGSEAYLRALETRYASIQELNTAYTTAFKSFDAVTTRQGMRVMNDRRAWLAAFDYRWCRRQALNEVEKSLISMDTARPLAGLLRPHERAVKSSASESGWRIVFEPALLETGAGSLSGAFPFAPGGYLNETAANAFRLFEFFSERALCSQVDFSILPLWEVLVLPTTRLTVVVNGKYMSRASFRALRGCLESGGTLLFPLGLPQYDEKMAGHGWAPSRDRVFATVAGRQLSCFSKDGGRVLFASPPFPFADSLWDDLQEVAAALLGEMGSS